MCCLGVTVARGRVWCGRGGGTHGVHLFQVAHGRGVFGAEKSTGPPQTVVVRFVLNSMKTLLYAYTG